MHNVFFSQSKAAHKASSMSTNLKGKVLTGKLLLRSQADEVQKNDAMCIEDMLYIEALGEVKNDTADVESCTSSQESAVPVTTLQQHYIANILKIGWAWMDHTELLTITLMLTMVLTMVCKSQRHDCEQMTMSSDASDPQISMEGVQAKAFNETLEEVVSHWQRLDLKVCARTRSSRSASTRMSL